MFTVQYKSFYIHREQKFGEAHPRYLVRASLDHKGAILATCVSVEQAQQAIDSLETMQP